MKTRINLAVRMLLVFCLIASMVAGVYAAPKKIELRAMVWAGSNQEILPTEVMKKYMKDHPNVSIEITEGQNTVLYPQMLAALKTTPDEPLFHMCYCNADITAKGKADNLFLPLNSKNIPNMAKVLPAYQTPQGGLGVCWAVSPITILYNTEKVKNPPKSWTELWNNPQYAGHVVLWDNMFYSYLTVAARLSGGDEQNIDPGFKTWAEHTGQIHSFVTSVDQMKNLFISGDAWIAPFFVAHGLNWAKEGVPVAPARLKEGIVSLPYYLQVVNGSSEAEKAECEKIINQLISPKNVARFADLAKVAPVVSGVKLPDSLKNQWFYSKEAVKGAINFNWEAMAKTGSVWRERWAKEVKSKIK